MGLEAGIPFTDAHGDPAAARERARCDVSSQQTQRNAAMPTTGPWYSTRPPAMKHHDNTRCIEGNNIEDRNLARGTGSLPLCRRCADLDSADK